MTSRSLLAVAIERRAWEVAALCLLIGVVEAASRLPPEALEELVDLLEGAPHARRRR